MGKLTQAKVDTWLKAGKPIPGRSDGSGLTFALSSKGTAAWTLRYRFAGRMRELTLSNDANLQDARKAARAQRVLIDQGVDPQAERRKAKLALCQAKTFEELSADYMGRAAPDLGDATRDHTRQYLDRDILPRIGSLRIEEVTGAEIVHMVEQVAKRSDSAARRVFQITQVIFAHGIAKHLAKLNPCGGLRLKAIIGKARPVREKVSLSAEELGPFQRALPACGLRIGLALRVLLATGARKGELLNARKVDVDLDGATWTVPADHAKNGQEFVIPLAPQVLEQFRKLVALAGSSEWLVPGQDSRQPASREMLNRAINALGLDRKVSPHDLRRTMRSHLGALGVDVIVGRHEQASEGNDGRHLHAR
jgi:integrase